ncbi:DUF6531 domain-containing protein, partial [Chitinivorax sp. B]|uniref:DUF6531 domain-containing protein n=1 Tax=Chitinivorax sp. B TaxID=2502235 RepID=UPI00201831C3
MQYLSMRMLNKSQILLGSLLGAAWLNMLSPLQAHAALAPVPAAVSELARSRVVPPSDDVLATRLDHELAQLQAALNRRRPAMAAFLPLPAGAEQPLDTASFTALLTRRLAALQQVRQDVAAQLGAAGLPVQIEARFNTLRDDVTKLLVTAGASGEVAAINTLQSRLTAWQQAAASRIPVATAPVPTLEQFKPLPYATDEPVITPQIRALSPAFERLSSTVPRETRMTAALVQNDCASTAADLKGEADTDLTADIRELASKLGNSPQRMFDYVANEIQFQPYYGALKGAHTTLLSQSGGATDQASLLIALLRAAGVPARYVRGQISFPVDDERVLRWLGAKTMKGAAGILSSGYNGSAGGVGLTATELRFNHVWVEACVPYTNYRGSGADHTGRRWVPLDPSFKEMRYQAGMAVPVKFDFTGFLRRAGRELPHEVFAAQVDAAVRTQDASASLIDVPYKGTLQKRARDILPTSLPYRVLQYTKWSNSNLPDTAQLPDTHRFQLTLHGVGLPRPTTLLLPNLANKRLTLSYKGYADRDRAAIQHWVNNPGQSSVQCTTRVNNSEVPIQVVSSIKLDGVEVAAGTTVRPFCTQNDSLALELKLPEINLTTMTQFQSSLSAANYHALFAYAHQASDSYLERRSAQLFKQIQATANPNDAADAIEGEFLHLVGLRYMRHIVDASKQIGQLSGESGESGNHMGLTSTQMRVAYLFDVPYAVFRSGFLIDVPGGQSRSVNLTTGESDPEVFLLSGYAASYYESYIWQEMARMDAVSTISGLKQAYEQGMPVIEVNKANLAQYYQPGANPPVNQLGRCGEGVASYFKNPALDPDSIVVRVPLGALQAGDWQGCVMQANGLNTYKNRFASFAINRLAGGATIFKKPSPTNSSASNGRSGLKTYNNDVVKAHDPSPRVASGRVSTGQSRFDTQVHDPVSMVTGNVYHVERDIAIKGRGLPLVFERSYNSLNPQDGPLGFGWTHSFRQSLKFLDEDEDDKQVDGLTSKVVWTDGSGATKAIHINGTAEGIALGRADFKVPDGYFFTLQRISNGLYVLTEPNGLTYSFESLSGKVNEQARLMFIDDRHGNRLSLGYDGPRLTGVVDALGRRLNLTYNGERIARISDWTGRSFNYEYDGAGNLKAFHNPLAQAGKQAPVYYDYYSTA